MTPEQKALKDQILKKLQSGETLSQNEEYFYLTVIMGHSAQEAETIMSIAENKDPNKIID